MDHEVHIVQQNPLRLVITFNVRVVVPLLLQANFHLVGDGLNLPGIGATAHNEVIGKGARSLFQFQDRNVLRLFFLAGADGF